MYFIRKKEDDLDPSDMLQDIFEELFTGYKRYSQIMRYLQFHNSMQIYRLCTRTNRSFVY